MFSFRDTISAMDGPLFETRGQRLARFFSGAAMNLVWIVLVMVAVAMLAYLF